LVKTGSVTFASTNYDASVFPFRRYFLFRRLKIRYSSKKYSKQTDIHVKCFLSFWNLFTYVCISTQNCIGGQYRGCDRQFAWEWESIFSSLITCPCLGRGDWEKSNLWIWRPLNTNPTALQNYTHSCPTFSLLPKNHGYFFLVMRFGSMCNSWLHVCDLRKLLLLPKTHLLPRP